MRSRRPALKRIQCTFRFTPISYHSAIVDLTNLKAFAHHYPTSKLIVVAQDVDRSYQWRSGELTITYCGLPALVSDLQKDSHD